MKKETENLISYIDYISEDEIKIKQGLASIMPDPYDKNIIANIGKISVLDETIFKSEDKNFIGFLSRGILGIILSPRTDENKNIYYFISFFLRGPYSWELFYGGVSSGYIDDYKILVNRAEDWLVKNTNYDNETHKYYKRN